MDVPLRTNIMLMAERSRGFLRKLTRRRLKHGVFLSIIDLQAAVNRFITEHNQKPRPFIWKADPDEIIAASNVGTKRWNQRSRLQGRRVVSRGLSRPRAPP